MRSSAIVVELRGSFSNGVGIGTSLSAISTKVYSNGDDREDFFGKRVIFDGKSLFYSLGEQQFYHPFRFSRFFLFLD